MESTRPAQGLDNSPLFDSAQFLTAENTIDAVDVGMTALLATVHVPVVTWPRALGEKGFVLGITVDCRYPVVAAMCLGWQVNS